ncbi:Macrophage mannose receptor 1 [Trichoplax sp. H2]|nr:Macrophage mannose receptor 1 [Trichoplax sp. H2]|eukprot:RDD38243.1 Macrophage mannose receptor 1 [Trichoplax sp. H2]
MTFKIGSIFLIALRFYGHKSYDIILRLSFYIIYARKRFVDAAQPILNDRMVSSEDGAEFAFLARIIIDSKVSLFLIHFSNVSNAVEKFWLRTTSNISICYHVPNMTMTATSARSYCQSLGGDLAILNTSLKNNDFVFYYYTQFQLDEDLWIGLRNSYKTPTHIINQWVNGQSVTFSNYANGEENSATYNCFAMQRNSTHSWYNEPCNNLHYFACQRNCSYNVQYKDRVYTSEINSKNYSACRTFCKEDGDLAIVNNEELTNIFHGLYFHWSITAWIGLEDLLGKTDAESYIWVDNSTTSAYNDWAFPTVLLFRCVMLYPIFGRFQWYDTSCSTMGWCLCERAAQNYSITVQEPSLPPSIEFYLYNTIAIIQGSANSVQVSYQFVSTMEISSIPLKSYNGISRSQCAIRCAMATLCSQFGYTNSQNENYANNCHLYVNSSN